MLEKEPYIYLRNENSCLSGIILVKNLYVKVTYVKSYLNMFFDNIYLRE